MLLKKSSMTNAHGDQQTFGSVASASASHKSSKFRMTIVMVAVVYPIVTLLLYAMAPLTNNWAIWHRTLILTPATVTLIVFVVSPMVLKHFDWFVRPR